jgi:hypothetical protein
MEGDSSASASGTRGQLPLSASSLHLQLGYDNGALVAIKTVDGESLLHGGAKRVQREIANHLVGALT